jgi:hypothetical protein
MVLCAFCALMEAHVPLIQMAHTESKVCALCCPSMPSLMHNADASGRILEQSAGPNEGGILIQH